MKMKKEHYSMVETAMHRTLRKNPNIKASCKRYRKTKAFYAWLVFNNSDLLGFQCAVLYEYLNDIHIQTAILRIVGEY